jgi:hypothetical protein
VPEIFQQFTDPKTFKLQFQIRLKNSGQTPAFDLFNVCRLGWRTKEEFAAQVVEAEPTSRTVLGPGSEMFAQDTLKDSEGKEIVLTFELLEALIQSGRTLWLKGHLLYRDINRRLWRHDYSWRLLEPRALLASPEPEGDNKWKRRKIGLYANVTGNDLRMIEDPNEKAKT